MKFTICAIPGWPLFTLLYLHIAAILVVRFGMHYNTLRGSSLTALVAAGTIHASIQPTYACNVCKSIPWALCQTDRHITQHFGMRPAWLGCLCRCFLLANESMYQYSMSGDLTFDVKTDRSFQVNHLIRMMNFLLLNGREKNKPHWNWLKIVLNWF